jgi:hypothetical protein
MNHQLLKKIAVMWCYGCMSLGLRAQGPLDGYLKGKGVLDLAPSFSFMSAEDFSGAGGQSFAVPYRGSMLSLFAAYGLSQRVDLVATAAYVFSSTQSGLQDGGIYGKYRPFYGKIGSVGRLGVLVGAGLAFPLSDYAPTATGALGQKAVLAPARLILQWELPSGLFLNLSGGYQVRFDRLRESDIARVRQLRPDYQPAAPPDFSTVLVKVGFPAAHFYTDVWLERQFTRGGADFQVGVPDLAQAYGVSYTQAGGVLYYSERGRSGVFVSGAYILSGRNTSRIRRVTLGAVFKFL